MGYRILIVDDSPVMRRIVARSVEMTGLDIASVQHAENGRQALELIAHEPFDVVFADINMPEMSGMEMVETLASTGVMPAQAVVILSTERSEERIARLRSLGVRAYLKKPFKPEDLKKVINALFPPPAASPGTP